MQGPGQVGSSIDGVRRRCARVLPQCRVRGAARQGRYRLICSSATRSWRVLVRDCSCSRITSGSVGRVARAAPISRTDRFEARHRVLESPGRVLGHRRLPGGAGGVELNDRIARLGAGEKAIVKDQRPLGLGTPQFTAPGQRGELRIVITIENGLNCGPRVAIIAVGKVLLPARQLGRLRRPVDFDPQQPLVDEAARQRRRSRPVRPARQARPGRAGDAPIWSVVPRCPTGAPGWVRLARTGPAHRRVRPRSDSAGGGLSPGTSCRSSASLAAVPLAADPPPAAPGFGSAREHRAAPPPGMVDAPTRHS